MVNFFVNGRFLPYIFFYIHFFPVNFYQLLYASKSKDNLRMERGRGTVERCRRGEGVIRRVTKLNFGALLAALIVTNKTSLSLAICGYS